MKKKYFYIIIANILITLISTKNNPTLEISAKDVEKKVEDLASAASKELSSLLKDDSTLGIISKASISTIVYKYIKKNKQIEELMKISSGLIDVNQLAKIIANQINQKIKTNPKELLEKHNQLIEIKPEDIELT